ncbi:ATP-binding protein [Variovorax sp. ZT4R33]|uniref:ATP-binding protein n=1 Tax=Variovorax sp. ZT4R33 TaxID=3443743 RepID=UPI003F4859EC
MAMRFAPLRWPCSLTARLLAISVGSLLLVLAVIGAGVAVVMSLPAASLVRDNLTSHVERLEQGMVFDAADRLVAVELPEKIVQMYDGLAKDVAYRVMDAQGATLFASPAGPALMALQREPLDAAEHYSSAMIERVKLRLLTTSVRQHGQTYIVQVARSERMVFFSLSVANGGKMIALMAGVGAMVLGVFFFCLLVLWTSRRVLRPLREASAVAAGIAPRNLTARLDAQRLPSELTPLIDAFNSALERLEKGYRVQQEFLASAAHELKTPLALIRAEIEIAAQPGREHLLKDVDLMARQVHQLLHLAEVSETRNYAFETCDASTVVADAVSYLARLAERHGVCVEHLPPLVPVPLQADGSALFILVKNLVENAIQHTAPGDTVSVRMDAGGLCVRNPGPRIAEDDKPKLFTRFWRGPGSTHEGAGLGLAICEEIAMAHGWRLSARNVPVPVGVAFELALSDRS